MCCPMLFKVETGQWSRKKEKNNEIRLRFWKRHEVLHRIGPVHTNWCVCDSIVMALAAMFQCSLSRKRCIVKSSSETMLSLCVFMILLGLCWGKVDEDVLSPYLIVRTR